MTSENPSLNMNLILKIIQGNTSIPVILCSETDSVVSYNNIEIPEKNVAQFMTNKVKELRTKNPPIVIDMEDGTYQYLYYDDSIILKRLLVYPYAQLSVVFVFILIAFLALASTKKAEQNKVWVGLSKETAHQLGTPISSLIAWVEYLRTKETVVRMEVPCCGGLELAAKKALQASGKFIPWQVVTISTDGRILE